MYFLRNSVSILFKSSKKKYALPSELLKCIGCGIRQLSDSGEKKKSSSSQNSIEVYNGVLTPQIRGVKMFSLMTSTAGILCQPIIYKQITETGGSVTLTVAIGTFIGFFTFVTPFLLHFITKKYVTKIDYHPDENKYSLTTLTFFLRPRTISFTPEDVEIPDIAGMFTSFNVKGKAVFVDGRLFPDPAHYSKIMGFDKPIDFKLGRPYGDDGMKKE